MVSSLQVEDFREEVVRLMRDLLRLDTTNPPGGETKAAELLKNIFEKEGIEADILQPEEGRGSLLARLEGTNSHPKMLWFSHLDVVPATDVEHWRHPPFSGEIEGDWIYGRGAIDTKCLTAVEAMALILLKRAGTRLKSPVILGAVADEEKGGNLGAEWLVEKHPDQVKAEYVLNEGAGNPIEGNGKLVYLIETAQKGLCWVKATAKGRPCHASIPDLGESAVTKLSTAISRIASHRPRTELAPPIRALMESLAEVFGNGREHVNALRTGEANPDSAIEQVARDQPEWKATLRALTRLTIAPTMVKGGVKENVVPDYAEGVVDCRLLPEQDAEYVLSELRKAIGDIAGIDLTPIQYHPASSSPAETPLLQAVKDSMESVLRRDIILTPYMCTGATDSRFLRELGSTAYGFMPFAPTMDHRLIQSLTHNVDERINIDSLTTGTQFFLDIAVNPPR